MNSDKEKIKTLEEELRLCKKELDDSKWGRDKTSQEIKTLYADLEKKSKKLDDLNKELESRVQDRTKQLSEAKDELEIQVWALDKTKKGINTLYNQLEQKNNELQKLDQLKNDFIDTVSHELRTPLTPIKEATSLVFEGLLGETTEKQRNALANSLRNIDRLIRIINNLLDVSKIESGKIQMNKESVSMAELITDAISNFSTQAGKKGLQLSSELLEKDVKVYADKDKTMQILVNLISNAIKFTDDGYIKIFLIEQENCMECSVADTGYGIAEGDLTKVFNKFQQFGRKNGPGAKGTGLGLAISKGIIEAQGGKMRVTSRKDKGAKFSFTIPKYTEQKALHEMTNNKIALACEIGEELSMILFKINNYDHLKKTFGQDKAREISSIILQALKGELRSGEFINEIAEDKMVVVVEADTVSIVEVNAKLKHVIKKVVFEIEEKPPINFSYGNAIYPRDGSTVDDLLKKCEGGLTNEKAERLKKTIMVVDDEPTIVNSLIRILQETGYVNFREANDGQEALDKIIAEPPDLIMLDMNMPKMSGYEVVGRLKENVDTENIPILIMSGYEVEIEKLDEYIKRKAIPMVGKPFDLAQIKRLVDYLL
ncbi:MAG: response regulator [Candidatus Omnitrophica bacterium]|nr:response regulator [Candidatus Omnitrophota bacterium]